MADFDMGYFYALHDKHEEERELSESGSGMVTSAVLIIIVSVLLSLAFRNTDLLVFVIIGAVLLMIGLNRQSRLAERKSEPLKSVNVELHHEPIQPHHYITRPSILRHKFVTPFSRQIGRHFREREHIARIIMENSGSDINAIFRIYKNEKGFYDAEHFVKAVHSLKSHGLVTVRKSISQPGTV